AGPPGPADLRTAQREREPDARRQKTTLRARYAQAEPRRSSTRLSSVRGERRVVATIPATTIIHPRARLCAVSATPRARAAGRRYVVRGRAADAGGRPCAHYQPPAPPARLAPGA